MIQRFYALAANTFTETVRQPIYGVILLVTFALMVLNVSLAAFTLDDDDKLLLDLGLNTLLLSGLFLAAFGATGVLTREIEHKTVMTVLSKPVGRPLFILGKFVGISAAVMVAFYLCFLVFVLAQRHGVMQRSSDPWDGPVLAFGIGAMALTLAAAGFCNYFYSMDFPTTALGFFVPLLTLAVLGVAKLDASWEVVPFASSFIGGQVILAAYLVMLNVVLVAAVALAAATRFGSTMTLLLCVCVVGLGIVSDHAFGQYAEESSLARFIYHALPNMGPFWVIDGLAAESGQTTVPFNYLAYTTAYAGLLTAGILALAVASFENREVG